ncbi:MAG: endonuclease/exonuclease/phosphatase family protein [Actinomycetota bacterium]
MSASPVAASARSTVATFNIRHGLGLDGRVDLARTAGVLRGFGADVVALQEIDRYLDRSGGVDQVAEIERLSGYEVAFFPTVERGRSQYGIALAASQPLDTAFLPLPRAGREEPRGAVITSLNGITYLATHLSPSPQARVLQIGALAVWVRRSPGPLVVMGDLNATRRALDPLVDAGLARPGWRPLTSPARLPRRQIDHILAGKGATVTARRKVRTAASDHLPVVALVAVG